ncbi:MAG: efflux RND transporter periplasmic adaptor subunit [Verrucomicrobia bacterium]|nr:efflux RND transporter periplasmic adaptor subunit [Verrucomicrobiota bacterium]
MTDGKSSRAMGITIAVFLAIGLGYFLYWLLWGQFHEYTDDAYVGGNKVIVMPQVPGIVTSLSALSTDYVVKGRVLVELDRTDAKIALDRSIAELGDAVRQVVGLFEQVERLSAETAGRKAEFVKSAQDYDHRKKLIEEGGVSLEEFEHATAALEFAFSSLIATEHAWISALAQVEGTTIETHPLVEKGKNGVRSAFVALERCTIEAPVTGIVAQRTVQVGEHVRPGQPLLSIVPLEEMWVDANYKENQLTHMRIGQKAVIHSDIYGREVQFTGTLVGIGGGTGSVFSILPPQNATGNWIKIVQRIPVKFELDPHQLKEFPLRLGLSMEVTVDIREKELPMIPQEKPAEPIYKTDVFAQQEEGAEPLIAEVIATNLSPTFVENREEP